MNELYIGLMSGTSLDGIDAVLVDGTSPKIHLLGTHQHPFPTELKKKINKVSVGTTSLSPLEFGLLDNQLGELFASSVTALLEKYGYSASNIEAIGCHGQTIFHQPNPPQSLTMQLGNPHVIAERTGITTVADFRRRDVVAGGQGAPLAPLFHEAAFRSTIQNRVILNIGGIANITILPKDNLRPISGFDTGPGNCLLDAWIDEHLNQPYDDEGNWALTGKVDEPLFKLFLKEPYFALPPPKSTGKELFNLHWVRKKLKLRKATLAPQDVQATLLECTVHSIAHAIMLYGGTPFSVYVCGGGIHNKALLFALAQKLYPNDVLSTEDLSLPPDWIEATTFAWLAKKTLKREQLNVPPITGAQHSVVLGTVFWK